jgi:tetratricopeptide (TPR) repeat protein
MNDEKTIFLKEYNDSCYRHALWCLSLIDDAVESNNNIQEQLSNIFRSMDWSLKNNDKISLKYATGVCDPITGLLGRFGLWKKGLSHLKHCSRIDTDIIKRNKYQIMLNQANYLMEYGNYEESKSLLNKVLVDPFVPSKRVFFCSVYQNLGIIEQRQNNTSKAKHYFNKVIETGNDLNAPNIVGHAHHQLGIIAADEGKHKLSFKYLQKSAQYSLQAKDMRGVAISLDAIGSLFLLLHEYDRAKEYFLKSLEIKEELGETRITATTLFNLSNMYRLKGDLGNSYIYWKKAASIFDNIDVPIHKQSKFLIDEMIELHEKAKNARNNSNFSVAIILYEKSIKFFEAAELNKHYANATYELAQLYLDEFKNYNKAKELLKLSVKVDKENNRINDLSVSLHALGLCYHYLNDFKAALNCYSESLEIDEKLGNKLGVAQSKAQIGQLTYRFFDKTEGTILINESIALFKSLEDDHTAEKLQKWFDYQESPAPEVSNKDQLLSQVVEYIKKGYLHERNGNLKQALNAFQSALNISEKNELDEGIAMAAVEVGKIIRPSHPYEAINFYKQSYKASKKVHFHEITATSLFNLANTYLQLEDYVSAKTHYKKCIHFKNSQNLDSNSVSLYTNYSACLHILNNLDEAKKIAQEAIELSERCHDHYGLARNCLNLAEIEADLDNYRESVYLCKKAINFLSEINAGELFMQARQQLKKYIVLSEQ